MAVNLAKPLKYIAAMTAISGVNIVDAKYLSQRKNSRSLTKDVCEENKISCEERDIYLLLDSSGSVGSNEWDKVKNISKSIVSNLDPQNQKIRFALLQFSDEVNVLATPLEDFDREDVNNITETLPFIGGDTHTFTAINAIIDLYDLVNSKSEVSTLSEIIIVTDGRVAPNSEVPCPLKGDLENRGIRVHIVAAGEADLAEVQCLTDLGNTTIFNDTDVLNNDKEFSKQVCQKPINYCPETYVGQGGDFIPSMYQVNLEEGELRCTYYYEGTFSCPTDSDMASISEHPHFLFHWKDRTSYLGSDRLLRCNYHLKCANPEKSEWTKPKDCFDRRK